MNIKESLRYQWVLSVLMALGFTTSVWAQDGPDQSDQSGADGQNTVQEAGTNDGLTSGIDEPAVMEEVTVVGSHIPGADITGALPVTVLSESYIEDTASLSFEELLGSLPQAGELLFNSENELSNDARGDVASLNLRTLGADTSLVLLNGRRITVHAQTQTFDGVPIMFVNMNAIPINGLGRIEVLRDGASALYGSDAVAGVMNAVLDTDFEGLNLSVRYGWAENNGLDEINAQIYGGFHSNDDRTNITYSANLFDRTGIDASELWFSEHSDYRDRPAEDDPFYGHISLRNLSSFTPWGEYESGFANPDTSDGHTGRRVRLEDGTSLTSSGGRFHLQPGILPGGYQIGDDLFLDDGSSTSSSNALPNFVEPLRYNINEFRKITPDTTRLSGALTIEHFFDNGLEFFSDLVVFDSDSHKFFGPPVLSTSNEFVIPANYYWNPFGPTTLEDGSVNPNRLSGIDAPDEGYDIKVRRFRFFELGPRLIDVDMSQYRILGGLRGDFGSWAWESALGYSKSKATDVSLLVSRTLLHEELSRTDAGAFNLFNGGNVLNPVSTANFGVPVTRKSQSDLTTADFRISNPRVFSLPAGDMGAAFGVEWRNEGHKDDRDERLDGTISFTNPLNGKFFDSDLLGVSATPDLNVDRNIYSLFGEVIVPIIDTFEAQIAARYEDYSDFGSSGVKPRIALSWLPTDALGLRGAWSEGFRAPNLVQTFQPEFSRFTNFQEDYSRCTFMNLCDDQAVTSRISGNTDLDAEDSTNWTVGFSLQPGADRNLTITMDYWSIEFDQSIGLFGRNNHIALDEYLRRVEGAFNPLVVRADPTPAEIVLIEAYNAANGTNVAPFGEIMHVQDQYLNLQTRKVAGVDTMVNYDLETSGSGTFTFSLNVAYLSQYDQEASPALVPLLNDPISVENVDPESVGSLIQVESRPEWRGNLQTRWRKGPWGVGLSARYIGEVFDPDVTTTLETGDEIEFKVDDFLTFDGYVDYRFENWGILEKTRFRLGVRNLTDESPPLFDRSIGYSSSLHSNRGRYWYLDLRMSF